MKSLEFEIEVVQGDKVRMMDTEEQKEFCLFVAKLNTVGYHCRPDIVYNVKVLNLKVGKATYQDLMVVTKKTITVTIMVVFRFFA